jgi:integrase
MQDMAKRAKYYVRRGTKFEFQSRIPKDLQKHYGKRILREPMAATTERAARVEAIQRHEAYLLEFEELRGGFDRKAVQEKTKLRPFSELSEGQVRRMVLIWFRDKEKKLHAFANKVSTEGLSREDAHNIMDDIAVSMEAWVQGVSFDEDPEIIAYRCDDIKKASSDILTLHHIDPKTVQNAPHYDLWLKLVRGGFQELAAMATGIMLEKKTAYRYMDNFYAGSPEAVNPPSPVTASQQQNEPLKKMTLAEAIEKCLEATDTKRAKTKVAKRQRLNFLLRVFGADKFMHEITRDDMRRAMNMLKSQPARLTRHYETLSLDERAALAKAEGRKLLEDNSIRYYRIWFSSLFTFAEEEDMLIGKSPMRRLEGMAGKKRKSTREIFTDAELQAIFSNGVWSQPPLTPKDQDYFWPPLLACFAGMRRAEACQLRKEHIREIHGVPCFVLMESEDEAQRVKTDAGERVVPVHSELIKLGFLQHISRCKKSERIFPNINEGRDDDRFGAYGKWLMRHFKKVGVHVPNKKVLHSMRNTSSSSALNNDATEIFHNDIFGWENRGMRAHYSKASIYKLYETVQKIQYPGLDLSHLYRR